MARTRVVSSSTRWAVVLVFAAFAVLTAPASAANFQFEISAAEPEEDGGFRHPADVAVDPEGNVWVVDTEDNRLQEFDESGNFLGKFGSVGTEPGELSVPSAIAIDAEGDIWVADRGNNRVQEFNDEGEPLTVFGEVGSENGQFLGPEGIAVDAEGNVWVADTYNARVQEFDSTGEFIQVIGTGILGEPTSVDVAANGDVWIADWQNSRVTVFDESGELVRHVGSAGTGKGEFERPDAIDVDAEGIVWVGDEGNDRVQRFNESGKFLGKFGTGGSGPGEFSFGYPFGLESDGAGHIWVTDPGNQRVQKWALGGVPTCEEGFATTKIGEPLTLETADYPCEGEEPLEFEIVEGPEHGEISEFDPETGQLTYDPEPGFAGSDFFSFEASNGFGRSEVTSFEILMSGVVTGIPERQLTFGGYGFGEGRFQHPADVAVGPEDHVYVIDSVLDLVQEFTPKGEFLSQFGEYGSGLGQMIHPSSLAFDGEGDIWIADTGNDRVEQFTANGEYISQFGSHGSGYTSYSEGHGKLDEPGGIALDASGNVYVSDTGNKRVQKFSAGGSFLAIAALTGEVAPGETVTPTPPHVADVPTGIAVGPAGDVWFADHANSIAFAQHRTSSLGSLGATGSIPERELRHPDAIDIDQVGNLWVGDERNYRVVRYDSEGAYIDQFGTWSGYPVENFDFQHPFGLDVDAHNRIWVTDPGNFRVQRWVEHTGQAPVCEAGENMNVGIGQPTYMTPGGLRCEGEGPLTYALVTPPEHGEISEFDPATGAMTYTPEAEYSGLDSFSYEVESDLGSSGETSFAIEVGEAPYCQDLQTSTPVEAELELELNCTGDHVEDAFEVVKGPAHGEISEFDPEAGTLIYTPDPAFEGIDRFRFQRTSWLHSWRATATIGVCEPPALEVGGSIAASEAPGVDLFVWATPDSWLCPGITSIRVSIDEEPVYSEDRDCTRGAEGCTGMEMVRDIQLPFKKALGSHEYEVEAEDEFAHPAEPVQLTKSTGESGTVWDLGAETSEEGECSNEPHPIGTVMVGTDCNDSIGVNRTMTLYRARGGNDVIHGNGNSETFDTGNGNDVIIAGRGSDVIRSGDDDDRVFGGSGDDEIYGGNGEDDLVGGPGADKIKGGGGNDLVRGGATTDKLFGGGGNHNTLSYADAVSPGFYLFAASPPLVSGFPKKHEERGVYVNLSSASPFADDGEVARFGGGTDEIRDDNFQDVIGSPFADLIVGSDDPNVIDAGAGTDVVRGRDGADEIYGGPDQDYLDGGDGEDALDGGAEEGEGHDTCLDGTASMTCDNTESGTTLTQPTAAVVAVGMVHAHSTLSEDSVYIRGTGSADDVKASGDDSAVTVLAKAGTIEAQPGCSPKGEGGKEVECTGSNIGSVLMWGGAGPDVLEAEGFSAKVSVTLLGGAGADHLRGSDQADDVMVDGQDKAADYMRGRKGDDTLFNNWGTDTLLAGGGNDLFVSSAICEGDKITGGPGSDNANWAQLVGPEIEPTIDGFPEKVTDEVFAPIDHGVNVRISKHKVIRQQTSCKGENEHDGTIYGVEDLEGSHGPDVLIGDSRPNVLLGRSGPDVLRGRAGNDGILANNRNPRNSADTRERKDLDRRLECGAGNDTIKLDPADKRHFLPTGSLASCETNPRHMKQPAANWRANPEAGEPEPETELTVDERTIGAVDDPSAPGPVAFFRLDETSGTDAADWMSPAIEEESEEEAEEETESEEELEEIAEEELEEEEELFGGPEEEEGEQPVGSYGGGVTLDQEGAMEESRAVTLDGGNDFIDLTSDFDPGSFVFNNCGLNVSGYSVEVWVKFGAEPSAREEIFSRSIGTEGLFLYRAADGRVRFSVVDGIEAPIVSSDEPIDDGEWHQIVAMMAQRGKFCASRGSSMAVTKEEFESLVSPEIVLYVDGFPQVLGVGREFERVIPENLTGAKNLVGAKLTSNGLENWLAGSVDDVAIYGHALTFNEVQGHLSVSDAMQPSAYLEPSVDWRDTDEDGVADSADNCAEVANEGQEDADLDGVGDACEPEADEDEDGVVDELDNCPEDANPLQEDLNENEIGDACEAAEEEE